MGAWTRFLLVLLLALGAGCERRTPALDEAVAACGEKDAPSTGLVFVVPVDASGRKVEPAGLGVETFASGGARRALSPTKGGCYPVSLPARGRGVVAVVARVQTPQGLLGGVLTFSPADLSKERPKPLWRLALAPVASAEAFARCGTLGTPRRPLVSLVDSNNTRILGAELAPPAPFAPVSPLGCVEVPASRGVLVATRDARLAGFLAPQASAQETLPDTLRLDDLLTPAFFEACALQPSARDRARLASGAWDLLVGSPFDVGPRATVDAFLCKETQGRCEKGAWLPAERLGRCLLAPKGTLGARLLVRVDVRAAADEAKRPSLLAQGSQPAQRVSFVGRWARGEKGAPTAAATRRGAGASLSVVPLARALSAVAFAEEARVGLEGCTASPRAVADDSLLTFTLRPSRGLTVPAALARGLALRLVLSQAPSASDAPREVASFPFAALAPFLQADAGGETRVTIPLHAVLGPQAQSAFARATFQWALEAEDPWGSRAVVTGDPLASCPLAMEPRLTSPDVSSWVQASPVVPKDSVLRVAERFPAHRARGDRVAVRLTRRAWPERGDPFAPERPGLAESDSPPRTTTFPSQAACLVDARFQPLPAGGIDDGLLLLPEAGLFLLESRLCSPAGVSTPLPDRVLHVDGGAPRFRLDWGHPFQAGERPILSSLHEELEVVVHDLTDDTVPLSLLANGISCAVRARLGKDVVPMESDCTVVPVAEARRPLKVRISWRLPRRQEPGRWQHWSPTLMTALFGGDLDVDIRVPTFSPSTPHVSKTLTFELPASLGGGWADWGTRLPEASAREGTLALGVDAQGHPLLLTGDFKLWRGQGSDTSWTQLGDASDAAWPGWFKRSDDGMGPARRVFPEGEKKGYPTPLPGYVFEHAPGQFGLVSNVRMTVGPFETGTNESLDAVERPVEVEFFRSVCGPTSACEKVERAGRAIDLQAAFGRWMAIGRDEVVVGRFLKSGVQRFRLPEGLDVENTRLERFALDAWNRLWMEDGRVVDLEKGSISEAQALFPELEGNDTASVPLRVVGDASGETGDVVLMRGDTWCVVEASGGRCRTTSGLQASATGIGLSKGRLVAFRETTSSMGSFSKAIWFHPLRGEGTESERSSQAACGFDEVLSAGLIFRIGAQADCAARSQSRGEIYLLLEEVPGTSEWIERSLDLSSSTQGGVESIQFTVPVGRTDDGKLVSFHPYTSPRVESSVWVVTDSSRYFERKPRRALRPEGTWRARVPFLAGQGLYVGVRGRGMPEPVPFPSSPCVTGFSDTAEALQCLGDLQGLVDAWGSDVSVFDDGYEAEPPYESPRSFRFGVSGEPPKPFLVHHRGTDATFYVASGHSTHFSEVLGSNAIQGGWLLARGHVGAQIEVHFVRPDTRLAIGFESTVVASRAWDDGRGVWGLDALPPDVWGVSENLLVGCAACRKATVAVRRESGVALWDLDSALGRLDSEETLVRVSLFENEGSREVAVALTVSNALEERRVKVFKAPIPEGLHASPLWSESVSSGDLAMVALRQLAEWEDRLVKEAGRRGILTQDDIRRNLNPGERTARSSLARGGWARLRTLR